MNFSYGWDSNESVSFADDSFEWDRKDALSFQSPESVPINNLQLQAKQPKLPKKRRLGDVNEEEDVKPVLPAKVSAFEEYLNSLDSESREAAQGIASEVEQDPGYISVIENIVRDVPIIPLPEEFTRNKGETKTSWSFLPKTCELSTLLSNPPAGCSETKLTVSPWIENKARKQKEETTRVSRDYSDLIQGLASDSDNIAADCFGWKVAEDLRQLEPDRRAEVASSIRQLLASTKVICEVDEASKMTE